MLFLNFWPLNSAFSLHFSLSLLILLLFFFCLIFCFFDFKHFYSMIFKNLFDKNINYFQMNYNYVILINEILFFFETKVVRPYIFILFLYLIFIIIFFLFMFLFGWEKALSHKLFWELEVLADKTILSDFNRLSQRFRHFLFRKTCVCFCRIFMIIKNIIVIIIGS